MREKQRWPERIFLSKCFVNKDKIKIKKTAHIKSDSRSEKRREKKDQSNHVHSSISSGVVFIFMYSFMLNTKGRLKGGQVFVY